MAPITTNINIKTWALVLAGAVCLFGLGAGIYWIRPSLGVPVLMTALAILFLLFLILGITALFKNRFAFKAALLGLAIAILLGGLGFYTTSPRSVDEYVYLIFCPPSLAAMALDNADSLGKLVGWSFIAVENAALYALVGTLLQWLWGHIPRIKGGG